MPRIDQLLITEEEIQSRVVTLGKEISLHYGESPITAVGILRGGLFFLSDLLRRIDCPATFEFAELSSYDGKTAPQGAPREVMPMPDNLAGKHVLAVEDIVDTGATIAHVRDRIAEQNPASFRIVTLLDKPSRRVAPVELDWVGFEIPDKFVVGYGLDYDQGYRNLPYIATLKLPRNHASTTE